MDYATLEIFSSYRGTDVEVFSREALERVVAMDLTESEREHVTLGMTRRQDDFNMLRVSLPGMPVNETATRLCVDTKEDLETVAGLIRYLRENDRGTDWRNIMNAVSKKPDLLSRNSDIVQKVV